MGRWHPWVMFTWDIMNSREFPFSSSVTVFDLQCVWIDIQKRSKASKWMLLLLKNYVSLHLHPPHPTLPLPHFLTLVFSSSPFFRLPQSPEFAAGQKAAAEAQPIWNAAPPSWRSERREGTRLVVNRAAQSTSCLYAQPTGSACIDLLHCSWQHAQCARLTVSCDTVHEWVNKVC